MAIFEQKITVLEISRIKQEIRNVHAREGSSINDEVIRNDEPWNNCETFRISSLLLIIIRRFFNEQQRDQSIRITSNVLTYPTQHTLVRFILYFKAAIHSYGLFIHQHNYDY